jgi:ABC-type uncharacterized transport system ATPase subunit
VVGAGSSSDIVLCIVKKLTTAVSRNHCQPTRGVDIGATEYIHGQLLRQRAEGLATLLASEDLDEVKAMSDRIMVLFDGEIMGIVNSNEVTIGQLG